MKALFLLYSKERGYVFEREVLAAECGIPDEKLLNVIANLNTIRAISIDECEINGEKRILNTVVQRYEIIALLAVANEYIFHAKSFNLQSDQRSKPYLE